MVRISTSRDVALNSRSQVQVVEQPHPLLQRRLPENWMGGYRSILCTKRLLWSGALLRMGNRRLTKRVMSGEQKKTEELGSGGRRNNGQIVWQTPSGFSHHEGLGHSHT